MDFRDLGDTGGAVGLIGGIVAIWHTITGQSRTRIGEIAIDAIEKSGKFMPAGEQRLVNGQLQKDVADTKQKVEQIHTLIFEGRITINRED